MDIWKGLAAGAAASLVSKGIVELWKKVQSDESKQKEDWSEVKSAEGIVVDGFANRFGAHLTGHGRERAIDAIHITAGTLAGAVANRARRRVTGTRPFLFGILWGVGAWLAVDVIAKPALGVTRGPTTLPWQTHARRLSGHVAYGLTRSKVRGLLEGI